MVLGGEPIDVCVCLEDEQILFYRDEPMQKLLAQAIFLWFWVDGQGYVLNEEFSQLSGEVNQ